MRIDNIPDSTPMIPMNQRPWGQTGRTITPPKVAARQKRSDQNGITRLVQAVRKKGLSARKSTRLVREIISQMEAALVRGEDVEVPGGKIVVSRVKGELRRTHCLRTNPDGTQEHRIHRHPGRRSVIKFRPGAVIDNHWPAETQQPQTRIDLESEALVQEIKAQLRAILGAAPTKELLSTLRKMFRNDSSPLWSIRHSLLFIQQTGLPYDAATLPGAIRMVEESEVWGGHLFRKAFDETLARVLGDILKDKPDPLAVLRDDLRYLNQIGLPCDPVTLPQWIGSSQSFARSLADHLNDGPPSLKFMGKVLNRFRNEKNPTDSLQRCMRFLPLGETYSQSAFLEAITVIEAIENYIYKLLGGVPPNPDFMARALKAVSLNRTGSKPVLSTLRNCLRVILSRGHVYSQQVLIQQICCFDYEHFPSNH